MCPATALVGPIEGPTSAGSASLRKGVHPGQLRRIPAALQEIPSRVHPYDYGQGIGRA